MKQSLTSARRPLEILIHIISWGIVFGFPFFFIDRTGDSINWHAYLRHSAVPPLFCHRILFKLFPPRSSSPLPGTEE